MDVLAGGSLALMTAGTIFTFSQAQLKSFATQGAYAQSDDGVDRRRRCIGIVSAR